MCLNFQILSSRTYIPFGKTCDETDTYMVPLRMPCDVTGWCGGPKPCDSDVVYFETKEHLSVYRWSWIGGVCMFFFVSGDCIFLHTAMTLWSAKWSGFPSQLKVGWTLRTCSGYWRCPPSGWILKVSLYVDDTGGVRFRAGYYKVLLRGSLGWGSRCPSSGWILEGFTKVKRWDDTGGVRFRAGYYKVLLDVWVLLFGCWLRRNQSGLLRRCNGWKISIWLDFFLSLTLC